MSIEKTLTIHPTHPSLAGHFPGNPIVPGVVILAEILELLGQSVESSLTLATIPFVKFHSPLRPNEVVLLTFDMISEYVVTFSCQVGSRQIASGKFLFQPNDQASFPLS